MTWCLPSLGAAEETASPTTAKSAGGEAGSQPLAAPVVDEATLIARLRSTTESEAVAAARKLGETNTPTAQAALLDALSIGVSPKVAAAALSSLSSLRSADALPVLELYTHHRNPDLRKRAVQGLVALVVAPEGNETPAKPPVGKKLAKPVTVKPGVAHEELAPKIVPQLIAALSDGSSDVRQVAAEALGQRREKSAEPALIKLLQRKDTAAPEALGLIGGPDTARALGEMIGTVPNYLLTTTLGALLRRSDFGPEPVRTEVVKMLGKMPGDQPVDFLSDYVKATDTDKESKARPSRAEAQKIIEQRTAK
ncbi:MAG: HEAT repeat domain-containing protein [Myxococcales bacterium]|nr:HEAT repeat domain-containing protein [Myxococcales bacterium]